MMAHVKNCASQFVSFVNAAVTPYHAVQECITLLEDAGFSELKESESWKVEPFRKYFVKRNNTCLLAFAVGGGWKPGNGFSMIAAHTDSPCLRVKPVSKLHAAGCIQVGVTAYGGGLWRTWFDRDLTVAGQVIVRNGDNLERRLVHVKKPLLYVPNLAIHLETDRDKFVCNKEDHLRPIIATAAAELLNAPPSNGTTTSPNETETDMEKDHYSPLLRTLAEQAGVGVKQVVDFDIYLCDVQPAAIGGLYDEFISGARLDNLVGTYTAVTALMDSVNDSSFSNDTNIRMALCYDNEECGSQSAAGAATGLTQWIMRRLSTSTAHPLAFEEAIPKSFLISADQAHAQHPNYRAKHEENHAVTFHNGVVVKINHNQRYATSSLTHAILKEVAASASVPLQKFVVRNDSPCGSTVGPIISSTLGLQTIDVGTVQLAMHSIRELACVTGIDHAQRLYKEFYNKYPDVWNSVK